MYRDEWEKLRRLVGELADVYAAAHPACGYLYRQEADEFNGQPVPADDDAYAARRAASEELRRRWTDRMRRGRP